jgi:hypothetical protein
MNFFDETTLPEGLRLGTKKAKAYSPVYMDEFNPVYVDRICDEMTQEEIVAHKGKVLLYDVECYPNFFCICFKQPGTEKVIRFVDDGTRKIDQLKLKWVMMNFCIIGYYSNDYDILMVQLCLQGRSIKQIYEISSELIADENMRGYMVQKQWKLGEWKGDHIDLIEVAPLRGSLKLYAGRLHCERMQDLPYHPTKHLTADEMEVVLRYCVNDLFSTELLFDELKPALELRYRITADYQTDVRSRSDAQIAERIISSELCKLTGKKPERPSITPGTVYLYKVPEYISYHNKQLQDMLEVVRGAYFRVGDDGYVDMPAEIGALVLSIGACNYRMGIGGLHSSEETIAHVADDNTLLIDRDVASFYPRIILNQALYPQHLGPVFLDVYNKIVEDRLKAKAEGNKSVAASLKITINGSFGKLGSKWSCLYAPDLMIQVTISGQLSLLMLIDMIEQAGIPIVSGNTDGVLIKCPKDRYDDLNKAIALWETITGFTTEETQYRAVYARDVNNYIALPLNPKDKVKVKGTYAERGSAGDSVLSKNPENLICNDALVRYLDSGICPEDTIRNCMDIRRFVTVRNVTGGGSKSAVPLGKTIRWYYSTQMQGNIVSIKTGNQIPNSNGARPLMQLPKELPNDIDYDRYINITKEMLIDVGHSKRAVDDGFAFIQ